MDGNIFEAMRLVLPEHREKMREAEREEGKQEPPLLADDAVEAIQRVIGQALRRALRLRVTWFDPHGNVEWEGVPVLSPDGQLDLRGADGVTRRVPLDKVVDAVLPES
jgi:hypothetical protein